MTSPLPARPQDVLPDEVDRTEIDGIVMRKGTVAAFVRNALRWTDPDTGDAERAALTDAIVEAVPALRALGVLAVFDIRDARLRALIAAADAPSTSRDNADEARA